MRGTYQAGVVHAFIMSGYFPGVIAGTSAGSITGTALALAAQMDDERERLALAEHHIDLWLQNPAQRVLDALVRGPLGALARDLADIDITLGELAKAISGDPASIVRLVGGLPLASRSARQGVLAGVFGAVEVALHGLESSGPLLERVSREVLMHAAQHVLASYGMEHALCQQDAIQGHFEEMVARFAPGGRACTLGALDRTELVFQTANLDRSTREGESTVVDLARGGCPGRPDFSSANLIAAMRASCAFAPFFAGIRARELGMTTLPDGIDPDHLLLDAAVVARDALSPAIGRWTHRPGGVHPHRLFAVHQSPLGPVSAPDGTSPFIGQALHSLNLRDGLDQRYSANVIELMTELVEALRRTGELLPDRDDDGRYVAVHVTAIAPREMLPFSALSVPTPTALGEACAAGCRAALEALHADSLHAMPGEGLVPCEALLRHLRATYRASFQPLSSVCASCSHMLARPAQPEPRMAEEEQSARNDFPPFHERSHRGARGPKPLTIAVPAGGVFLGVFQFGAIAALEDYGITPDLYAGASVGTIFSYLLDSCLRDDNLPKIVELALTVPRWVDAEPGAPKDAPGYVDWVRARILERWESDAVRPLRDLRPREIAAMLAEEPRGEAAETWERFRRGLGALLFTPLPGRDRRRPRALADKYRLDSDEWSHVHKTLQSLTHLRLEGAVALLDEIAANLGFFTPGPDEARGEVIGFAKIAAEMASIVFPDGSRTLDAHAAERGVRFIFTVTNHTRGQLEHFGFADDSTTTTASPDAIEAALAASSFPLAFRRRSRAEIFGAAALDRGEDLYADGGIFNNFPSDTAFAYLHALTGRDETRWLGEQEHQVILLSLTSPTTLENEIPEADGLLWTFARAMARIDDEKVQKTLRGQHHINVLAAKANPILRDAGARQAIRAKLISISPAYGIYEHAFAFKEYLGFSVERQEEMLASGCRRARLALEWSKDLDRNRDRRRLPQFIDEIRDEVARVESRFPRHYPEGTCLFGRFSPHEGGGRCPFTKHEATQAIFERCEATIDRELSVPNLKL